MALEFRPPPEWLLQQYINRPNSAEKAAGLLGNIGDIASEYVKSKMQERALASLDAQRKAAEFKAVADYVPEDRIPALAKSYGINIPSVGNNPPTPSTTTLPSMTPNEVAAGQSLPSEHPANIPDVPQVSPLIQAHSQATGFNPLGLPIPTSKAGLAKYKTNLETQKLQKEMAAPPKPEDKYYTTDQAKSLLKNNPNATDAINQFPKDQVPRDAVHLMMSQGTSIAHGENQAYVGNSEDGSPVNQDKNGNFFVNGMPYHGKILMKNSETPTSSTRSSAEFANTIIPHIQDMRDLIKEADKKGYIGPAAGRVYNQFMAGTVGSTGNSDADTLLGQLRATDSLLKTGAMRVHFGARGGQQMYDHFSDLLNSGKQSAAMLNGSLDTLESFMKGYSNAGRIKQPQPSNIPMIKSDEAFNKLPAGTRFKDETGAVHTKK